MEGANGSVGVTPTGVIVVRLLASALMAAVIGWERSFSQKPAGARTMIMIGVGAAAFALLGEELLVARAASEGVTADPTRVLAYIISGVGFLGAGSPPEIPSWGNIMSEGRTFFQLTPWIIFFPGICLAVTVLAVNVVGDGLRDTLDPRIARNMR